MKKILYILVFCLFSVLGISQTTAVPGTTPLITPQNARASFILSLRIPSGMDTSLNGGIDSTGSMFFQLRDSVLYLRVRNGVSGKWVPASKKGDTSVSVGEQDFTATGGQTNFTTGVSLPSDSDKITVYRNGVSLAFTKSGNTITIIDCDAGDIVKIKWIQ